MTGHSQECLSALPELVAELARARAKFPGSRFLLIALAEEVGELADALISDDRAAARKEAVQVACVAMRIAEEIDNTPYDLSPTANVVALVGAWCRAMLQRRAAPIRVTLGTRDPIFDDMTDAEAKP